MATDTIFNVGKAIVGGVMLDDHISKFLETAYVIVLAKESATFQNRRILDILKSAFDPKNKNDGRFQVFQNFRFCVKMIHFDFLSVLYRGRTLLRHNKTEVF